MKTILVLILTILGRGALQDVWANVGPADNAGYFGVLCRLYNIAAQTPISFQTPTELVRMRGEIDAINASLGDEEWYAELIAKEDPTKLSEEFKSRNGEIEKHWKRWRPAVLEVQEGSKFKRLPPTSSSVKLAQRKLIRVEERVAKLLDPLEKWNEEEKKKESEGLFEKAIYGETIPKDRDKPMPDRAARGESCGAHSSSIQKGTLAGTSLVLDLHCLCASQDDTPSNGIKDACGVDVGTGGAYWGASLTDSSGKMWGEIKKGCQKFPSANISNPPAWRPLLDEFLNTVAVGGRTEIAAEKRKPGMLGTSATSGASNLGCNGQKASGAGNGICVYYGTSEKWNEIKWLKNMRDGSNIIEEINSHANAIKQAMEQLKLLHTQAEEIYEETKTAVEFEKTGQGQPAKDQSQKQNPTTSSDKATAQEVSAVNTATIARLILPWTLLI